MAQPVSHQLTGVNNEWVDPLGLFVQVHRNAQGGPAGWLPPNVSKWANTTDPFRSASLASLMRGLNLGSHRYPGGSIGNWWDLRHENFSADVRNASLDPASAFHATIADVMSSGAFAPGTFGIAAFDAMARDAGAETIISLDVSAGGGADPAVPSLIAARIGGARAARLKLEIGNEVYNPRQGPQPGGFATAQDYLSATAALREAAHAVPGARVGVCASPCPLFFPEGSACWGGSEGRYHKWNANLSRGCREDSGGARRCDAVVGHNYIFPHDTLAPLADGQLLGGYLAAPQVTMDFGVASLARDYPAGTKLWISEYNTQYADAWNGRADAPSTACPHCRLAFARFLNSTENSGAHALQVAAFVMAGMAHAGVVEVMNYHSYLEGAGPGSLGPQSTGGSQPGFAIAAINETGAYVSPVAQMLSVLAALLSAPNATMESVPQPTAHGAPLLPFTLAAAGLGNASLPCVQAVAICAKGPLNRGAASHLLALNRCARAAPVRIDTACGGAATGWASVSVYNASLAPPGTQWARAEGPQPWGPMRPEVKPAGTGVSVVAEGHALSFVELLGE